MSRIAWVASGHLFCCKLTHGRSQSQSKLRSKAPIYENGEDSARWGLVGLEKEWPAQQVRKQSLLTFRLSHQVMLGGYQMGNSFTALYPTGFR